MLGILLMTIGTSLEELSTTIGKSQMRKRIETPYTYGVLTSCVMLLMFSVSGIIRFSAQHFDFASIPTLAIRAVLEIIQASASIFAIKLADRSTYGFIRTITIPGLLVADVALGYAIDSFQMLGIVFIVLALILLFINHGFSKHGTLLVLVTAVNAVFTTSIYKYDITHFNSPEIEQIIIISILVIFFVAMAKYRNKQNPFRLFKNRICLAQAGLIGVGSTLDALSLMFGLPSILVSVKRTTAVLMSVLLGRTVFAEKHLALKIVAFTLCAIGILLLTL